MERRPDRSGTPRTKPGGRAVSPVILSLRPKVVAGRRVLGDLPYFTDSAVAQVEDENDLVIENSAVALSVSVMQAESAGRPTPLRGDGLARPYGLRQSKPMPKAKDGPVQNCTRSL